MAPTFTLMDFSFFGFFVVAGGVGGGGQAVARGGGVGAGAVAAGTQASAQGHQAEPASRRQDGRAAARIGESSRGFCMVSLSGYRQIRGGIGPARKMKPTGQEPIR